MYNSIWYDSLIKPPLAPPNEIFTPVWAFLYVTLAVSLLIYIFSKTAARKKAGYVWFVLQLGLNAAWPFVFFSQQNIFAALIVLFLLNIAAAAAAVKFYSVSKISAFLLLPYLLWIIFALYLNAGYFILNS